MEARNGETDVNNRNYGVSNANSSEDSFSSDEDYESGMRVGDEFQARTPECDQEGHQTLLKGKGNTKDSVGAIMIWSPTHNIPDAKLDEYLNISKEKHGYTQEQGLGMLFWHKHYIERSLADLANFTPFPDEWTVEDKVLFEQAFSFHGKSFTRIRQMLPDKTIAQLVKYYYSWKKTRTRTSLMDRQARKLANHKETNASDDSSDASAGSDTDFEPEKKDDKDKGVCSNCSSSASQLHSTAKGSLCNPCYQYWRRTGLMKSHFGVMKNDSPSRNTKARKKPPRGMHISLEDLNNMATGKGEILLKNLDHELVSLKQQVQSNKMKLSIKRAKMDSIEKFRPPENNQRLNARWTNDELLIAVQAVRKYGKDFEAMAQVVSNKTPQQCRNFFINYRRRYNLQQVLEEYENEHGLVSSKDDGLDAKMDEDMEVADSPTLVSNGSNSGGTPVPAPSPVVTTATTVSTTAPSPVMNTPPPLKPSSGPNSRPMLLNPQQSRYGQQLRPSTGLHQPPPLIRPSGNALSRGRPPIMGPLISGHPPPQLFGAGGRDGQPTDLSSSSNRNSTQPTTDMGSA